MGIRCVGVVRVRVVGVLAIGASAGSLIGRRLYNGIGGQERYIRFRQVSGIGFAGCFLVLVLQEVQVAALAYYIVAVALVDAPGGKGNHDALGAEVHGLDLGGNNDSGILGREGVLVFRSGSGIGFLGGIIGIVRRGRGGLVAGLGLRAGIRSLPIGCIGFLGLQRQRAIASRIAVQIIDGAFVLGLVLELQLFI